MYVFSVSYVFQTLSSSVSLPHEPTSYALWTPTILDTCTTPPFLPLISALYSIPSLCLFFFSVWKLLHPRLIPSVSFYLTLQGIFQCFLWKTEYETVKSQHINEVTFQTSSFFSFFYFFRNSIQTYQWSYINSKQVFSKLDILLHVASDRI